MTSLVVLAQTGAIDTYYGLLLALGLVFGFLMAWSIGANDVANAMGTSVGSGALTLKRALIVAGVLEFLGAVLVGQHVTGAIRKGILPPEAFASAPDLYVFGMLSALLASATWLLIATYYGLPVSTTHTIVGAIIGFGILILPDWGFSEDPSQRVAWSKVGQIIASWIVSPLLAGTLSFIIFSIIQRRVLYRRDLVRAGQMTAPFFVFGVFFTLTLVTLWKGLEPLKLDFGLWEACGLASVLSLGAAVTSIPLVGRIRPQINGKDPEVEGPNPIIAEELERLESRTRRLSLVATGEVLEGIGRLRRDIATLRDQVHVPEPRGGSWGTPELRSVERIFIYLQILSACAVAFAHGANDVANAVGPLSGIIHTLTHGSVTSGGTDVDRLTGLGILTIGGIGIVLGLGMWGRRVIETIGKRITELTPTRGFSAEFGAAITILLASRFALPVSTTHTLVGAVFGVGLARGVGALDLRVMRDIVASWIITLPAGAILAMIFYKILSGLLS